ncbi:MAG: DUF2851 family protein [Bacteroidota bacterium]
MHEDLLRHIWSKQLFDSSRLTTSDGRAVRILHPGVLSRGSGPDFRNARIDLDGRKYSGDIEFHRNYGDWKLHHHHYDPNYNTVILHVVLSGIAERTPSQSGRIIPTVVLEPFLHSSIDKIADQLKREEYSSKQNCIPCFSVNDSVDAPLLNTWIRTLYKERLQEKTNRLAERLREIIQRDPQRVSEPEDWYGDMPERTPLHGNSFDVSFYKQKKAWEQLLYEEVLDCLGYSNNRTPMKRLAEQIPVRELLRIQQDAGAALTTQQIEAILFKASGLLPTVAETQEQDSKVYIHSLHTAWSDLNRMNTIPSIGTTEWDFSPTRPANFPTIRIAAAAVFLHNLLHRSLFKSIITLVSGKYSSVESKIEQLQLLFTAGDHPFWNYHFTFAETADSYHAILGRSRIGDIIMNAVLPFVSLYAAIFAQEDTLERCLSIAAGYPSLEDNSILRTMDSQVLKRKIPVSLAYQQQGLIHLYKRYCMSGKCGVCEIGKKVFT